MTALWARHLAVSYGAHTVVRDLSFEVAPGRLVGLVGPNGAGKTSLLKALAGLLPVRGEVGYGSLPLASLSQREQARLRVYVPQGDVTAFPYRVSEVVAMGRAHRHRLYATPSVDQAVHAALAEVDLAAASDRRFDTLSGGERQLVLVARALAQEAPLLLLDEPTSHLDLKHRAAVVRSLKARVRAGAAVLWSLHDLGLAAQACDEVIVLKEGTIAAHGAPAEALRHELLESVYEAQLAVVPHPLWGTPTIELDPRQWS